MPARHLRAVSEPQTDQRRPELELARAADLNRDVRVLLLLRRRLLALRPRVRDGGDGRRVVVGVLLGGHGAEQRRDLAAFGGGETARIPCESTGQQEKNSQSRAAAAGLRVRRRVVGGVTASEIEHPWECIVYS